MGGWLLLCAVSVTKSPCQGSHRTAAALCPVNYPVPLPRDQNPSPAEGKARDYRRGAGAGGGGVCVSAHGLGRRKVCWFKLSRDSLSGCKL